MGKTALIAGGGIGGLAAAFALGRAGWGVQLFERAAEFSEVGAGIQMGPNVTRVLDGWGLTEALNQIAAFPSCLQVRNASSGRELGVLPLGDTTRQRYGAPYATIHRADILGLLLTAVQQQAATELRLDSELAGFIQNEQRVLVRPREGASIEGDLLVGADGLWSPVRQWLLNDGMPRVTGHLAYRALVSQAALPQTLRSQHVTVWLGPRLHVVQYPVRRGEWLNVVAIVHDEGGKAASDATNWDQNATVAGLRTSLAGTCSALQDLINAMTGWRLWALCDRNPMAGAHEHGAGRVVLVGDAAHPMRPYLAQGAGMAIEDAAELERVMSSQPDVDIVPTALGQFAHARWQRNARVQARSIRNGEIFHASGPVRWGRDVSLGLLGKRLLDQPWLYR
jgi:salicylate hydroxylase